MLFVSSAKLLRTIGQRSNIQAYERLDLIVEKLATETTDEAFILREAAMADFLGLLRGNDGN